MSCHLEVCGSKPWSRTECLDFCLLACLKLVVEGKGEDDVSQFGLMVSFPSPTLEEHRVAVAAEIAALTKVFSSEGTAIARHRGVVHHTRLTKFLESQLPVNLRLH
jgi:hypothetical protein